jgi:hypothetical protein
MGASVCTLSAAVNGAFRSGEPGGTTATTSAMGALTTIPERGAPVSQSEEPRHSDAHPAAIAPLPLPAVHGDALGVLRQPDRRGDTDTPSGTEGAVITEFSGGGGVTRLSYGLIANHATDILRGRHPFAKHCSNTSNR